MPDGRPSIRSRAPKPRKRHRRLVRLSLVFVTAVVLLDAVFGEKGVLETLRARREYTELDTEVARLRAENADLRETARRLRDDPAAIEELARRDLGFIRPGETLFIIRDTAPADARPGLPPAPEMPPVPAPPAGP